MAIDIEFQTIVDPSNPVAINANFDAIVTALQEAVSRDGTTPNQMNADLDMNGFRIINAEILPGDSTAILTDGTSIVEANIPFNNFKVTEVANPTEDTDASNKRYVDISVTPVENDLAQHLVDFNNPHMVDKGDVGLGNADNTSDADKPISTATQAALDLKANDSDLTSHVGDTSNPHSVTKNQVGLGNADNTSDLNKPISTATQAALDLNAAALVSHETDTTNPHSVTKAQVGLSNADNTSDASKPISAATQTALDAKAPIASPSFTGDGSISGNWSVNGDYIEVGETSGSVALTVNDGGGNASVTFNHKEKVPDSNGSAARISADVDSTTAVLSFELADNVTSGVGVTPTRILKLTTSDATLFGQDIFTAGTLSAGTNITITESSGIYTISATGTVSAAAEDVSVDLSWGGAATDAQAAFAELNSDKAPIANPALTGAGTLDGSPLVTETTIATPAVQQILQLDYVSPKTHGIDTSGNVDQAAQLQTMLNDAVLDGKHVKFGFGTVRCESDVVVTPGTNLRGLYMKGVSANTSRLQFVGGTSLIFNGGGVSVNQTSQFHAENMGFYRLNSGPSDPILDLNWTGGSGQAAKTGSLRNCEAGSNTVSSTFQAAVKITNGRGFNISNCRVLGDYDGNPITSLYGIWLLGDSDPVAISIEYLYAYYLHYGVYVDPSSTIEGLGVFDGEFVGCRTGVSYLHAATGQQPWMKVERTHMNVSRRGIEYQNINNPYIVGNYIYANASQHADDTSGAWRGITQFDNFPLIDKIGGFISRNQIYDQNSITGETSGIRIDSTRGDIDTRMDNNTLIGLDIGTYEGPGVTGLTLGELVNSNIYRNCTQDHVDI